VRERSLYKHVCDSEWFCEVELLEPPGQIKLNLCLYGWITGEVCKMYIDTPEELLARILDAAVCIKRREDQLRRTTRDLRTRSCEVH